MSGKNYYQRLGIQRDAGEAAIKAAYRRLARQHHPDSTDYDSTSNIHFHDIDEAYETLRDPELRAAYDATLNPSPAPQPVQPSAKSQAWRYEYTPPKSTAQDSYKEMDEDSANLWASAIFVLFFSVVFIMVIIIADQTSQRDGNTWNEITAEIYSVQGSACDPIQGCKKVFYRYTVQRKEYRGSFLIEEQDYNEGDQLTIEYRDDVPRINRLPEGETEQSDPDPAPYVIVLGIMFLLVIIAIFSSGSTVEAQRV